MEAAYHYRMWLFALALVLLQFLLSDEGKRIMSTGLWHTSLTVCSIGCVLLAWPYVKENTLKVWHGEAYFWPVAILVVSALAIVVMTWLATYSHMASLSGEQSDNAGALGLQQKLEADLVTAKQQAEIERKATQGVVARATVLNETIEALTTERDTLQSKVAEKEAEIAKMNDKQTRFDRMYKAMEALYESAPDRESFSAEEAKVWAKSAQDILFHFNLQHYRAVLLPHYNDYTEFRKTLDSFRRIMGQITIKDLSD